MNPYSASARWARAMIRLAPALAFLSTFAPAARAGEPAVDFGIVGVDYSVSAGQMNMIIYFVSDLPFADADWYVPVRILFNGEVYEVDHGVTAQVVTGPGVCTAPVDGACEVHTSPCATTTYTYKAADTLPIDWTCEFDPGGPGPADDDCDCRPFPFRPATLPKSFAAPLVPGTFEFIVDPDNEIVETDETNNLFVLEYDPAGPPPPYESEADWIEVTFAEGSRVRLRDGDLVDLGTPALAGVSGVLAGLDGYEWQPISNVSEPQLDALRAQGMANTGEDVPDLNNVYRLHIVGGNVWDVATSLETLSGVALARPVPLPEDPPTPPPFEQEYVAPAAWNPSGMGHEYFRTVGNDGTGVSICDVEYDWNYDHADITKAVGSQIGTNVAPLSASARAHGTAVAGMLVADDNGWGITGLCSGASFLTSGAYFGTPTPTWNPAGAILTAIAHMPPGSVILLEQQWNYDDPYTPVVKDYVPIEWWLSNYPAQQMHNAVFQAIQLAASNRQYVVEPAGNGGYDLDSMVWAGDSGAIIVGAGGTGDQAANLERMSFSSYGSRVDVQGWGEDVVTTGESPISGHDLWSEGPNENYDYTSTFNGTSSASAHVATAVACYSGFLANTSGLLDAVTLRSRLIVNGSAQVGPASGYIGPRPDLIRLYVGNAPPPISDGGDYGDAPEGVLAYPNGVIGAFPTLFGPSLAADWMMHVVNPGLLLGSQIDLEYEGNGGQPFIGTYYTYDADECQIGSPSDDGLIMPTAFTIDHGVAKSCNGTAVSLGAPCGIASWGTDIDITVSSTLPGFLSALVDWNQNGTWGGTTSGCAGQVPELILQNVPIPPTGGVEVPLSQLVPGLAPVAIGPNAGYAWARFTLTDTPLPFPATWTGGAGSGGWGTFPFGETEDYLLAIGTVVDVAGGTPPAEHARLTAAPNPFRAGTELRFDLDVASETAIDVFDVTGRRVRTLDEGRLPAGMHAVGWDGRNAFGTPVAPGIYFARIRANGAPETLRLTVVR